MDLSGKSQQQLVDMVIKLASSITEEDLEDPQTFALASQLTQLLSGKAEPLPAAMVNQLGALQDKAQRFRQAAAMIGAFSPEKMKALAESMKAAGLLKRE